MLLDTIAIIILLGMMLIPVVNIFAGVIVGAGLGGAVGALGGFLLALFIMAAERYVAAWLAAFERKRETRRAAPAQAGELRAGRHRRPTASSRPAMAQTADLIPAPAHIVADGLLDATFFAGGISPAPPSPK
jgi:hypothetical protein